MHYVVDQSRPHLGGNIAGGDSRTYYPVLWNWLASRFDVSRMLDVGCGEGQAVAYWRNSLGVDAIGLDGLPYNISHAAAHGPAILCDLTRFACPVPGVDLVWCCEVVEHVKEEHIENLLDTICCGRTLAVTHAVPGQGGWHHVNCRPAEYWIEAIGARGLKLDSRATAESRELAGDFWALTGLIFSRGIGL